jgi:hypothetical protein
MDFNGRMLERRKETKENGEQGHEIRNLNLESMYGHVIDSCMKLPFN